MDGSLNRRVMDRLLGSLLSHLQDRPGQTARVIADHFDPYMTPRSTYELLKVLPFPCWRIFRVLHRVLGHCFFFFRFWINSVAFERSASTLLRKKLRSSRLLTWRIGVSVASTRIKMLDRQNVILIAFNQHSVCHLFLVFIWSGDEDVLEDVDVENIIYEPTIDSFVRLGAFVAQKEYAKSFLGEEFV